MFNLIKNKTIYRIILLFSSNLKFVNIRLMILKVKLFFEYFGKPQLRVVNSDSDFEIIFNKDRISKGSKI